MLGVHRSDGSYVGIPRRDTEIYAGDTVVLYGRSKVLRELTFRRDDPSGQKAHEAAVSDQKSCETEQERHEEYYRQKNSNTPDTWIGLQAAAFSLPMVAYPHVGRSITCLPESLR